MTVGIGLSGGLLSRRPSRGATHVCTTGSAVALTSTDSASQFALGRGLRAGPGPVRRTPSSTAGQDRRAPRVHRPVCYHE